MKLTLDTDNQTLAVEDQGTCRSLPLFSGDAFRLLSREWLCLGWNQKYTYSFTWLGRPIIQLPEDLIRIQEVLFSLQPDVILETGVAHGGSLIFYASLCRLLGKGRVIGIDVEIRPHNRRALEEHFLYPLLSLVEGDSTAHETVTRARSLIRSGENVLVILDSCHTRQHVLAEMEAYSPLVTQGSYLVVQDGIMQDLANVPRGKKEWSWDNPITAVQDFLPRHPEFRLEPPARLFDESLTPENLTHWPSAWLRRI